MHCGTGGSVDGSCVVAVVAGSVVGGSVVGGSVAGGCVAGGSAAVLCVVGSSVAGGSVAVVAVVEGSAAALCVVGTSATGDSVVPAVEGCVAADTKEAAGASCIGAVCRVASGVESVFSPISGCDVSPKKNAAAKTQTITTAAIAAYCHFFTLQGNGRA